MHQFWYRVSMVWEYFWWTKKRRIFRVGPAQWYWQVDSTFNNCCCYTHLARLQVLRNLYPTDPTSVSVWMKKHVVSYVSSHNACRTNHSISLTTSIIPTSFMYQFYMYFYMHTFTLCSAEGLCRLTLSTPCVIAVNTASSLECTTLDTVLQWEPRDSIILLASEVRMSVGSPVSVSISHWAVKKVVMK